MNCICYGGGGHGVSSTYLLFHKVKSQVIYIEFPQSQSSFVQMLSLISLFPVGGYLPVKLSFDF